MTIEEILEALKRAPIELRNVNNSIRCLERDRIEPQIKLEEILNKIIELQHGQKKLENMLSSLLPKIEKPKKVIVRKNSWSMDMDEIVMSTELSIEEKAKLVGKTNSAVYQRISKIKRSKR